MSAFVKFTDPHGDPAWICARWVTRVTSVRKGEYAEGAHTLISIGVKDQAVRESPEDVVRMLEQHSDIA